MAERQSKKGGARRPRGRPKGSVKGRIKTTFAIKASPEYKTWLTEFANALGGEMSDVAREALRLLAEQRGFRPPPLK
jgi:hypothetical protein